MRMAKKQLRKRLSRALRLPADAALPVPRLELTGSGDLLVTGGAELLEYEPERICLIRDTCRVSVFGTDLTIVAMDRLGMQIYGNISSVTFQEEADHAAALS